MMYKVPDPAKNIHILMDHASSWCWFRSRWVDIFRWKVKLQQKANTSSTSSEWTPRVHLSPPLVSRQSSRQVKWITRLPFPCCTSFFFHSFLLLLSTVNSTLLLHYLSSQVPSASLFFRHRQLLTNPLEQYWLGFQSQITMLIPVSHSRQ